MIPIITITSIVISKWPEQWSAERSRDENGNLVFKKISDSSNMHQESGSSGNRREFLDMMLNWELVLRHTSSQCYVEIHRTRTSKHKT